MTSSRTSSPSRSRGRDARFTLSLWTDDPALAAAADRAGIDRVGLDLERLGKQARQADDPTMWLSPHVEGSLAAVRAELSRASVFVRTNPLHAGWRDEVDRLLDAGAEVLMLPDFGSADDVAEALAVIGRRALLVPLLETVDALADVERLARLEGLVEVHVGLNDLSRGLGVRNRFAVLVRPELERAAVTLRAAGLRVGVGGIARADSSASSTRELPIPSDLVYAQYPRLGATGALIARSFLAGLPSGDGALRDAVAAARSRLAHWQGRSATELEAARDALADHVRALG
jgi:2-keto-3-deoxy-L-rhamnonate aldolase RhmA